MNDLRVRNNLVSFWRRQFTPDFTSSQNGFDYIFGIFAPLLCLYFDLVVFQKDWGSFMSTLGNYIAIFYYSIVLQVAVLAFWLLFRRQPLFCFVAFFTGFFLSFGLGLEMLPFSYLGIVLNGLGLLGLIPFLTALVFLRNAARAWQAVPETIRKKPKGLFVVGLAGFLFLLAPVIASKVVTGIVDDSIQRIIEGDAKDVASAVRILRLLRSMANLLPLGSQYLQETDPVREQILSDAYAKITDDDIETVIARWD